MRTIEIVLYTFNELSEDAKHNAIDNLRDSNTPDQWWEFIYEDAENIGLKINSFDLDRNRHAEGIFELSAAEVAANIIKDHGDQCETYAAAQSFLDEHDPIFAEYFQEETEELEDKLMELENDFLNELLECYSIMLQNEYEYYYTDESVLESIHCNDYEFTENGTPA